MVSMRREPRHSRICVSAFHCRGNDRLCTKAISADLPQRSRATLIHLDLNLACRSNRAGFGAIDRKVSVVRLSLALLLCALAFGRAVAAEPLDVKIGYLRRAQHQETISLVQMPAPDNGLPGAALPVTDNATPVPF